MVEICKHCKATVHSSLVETEHHSRPAQGALDMLLARSIAHKHCTCTCRDDPKVMQGHTNFCDEITKAISEYISAVTSTER